MSQETWTNFRQRPKIKPSKCKIFKREVSYLERLASAEGYTVDSKSLKSITSKIRKKPNNISELCSLLGLVGYFRRLIPNFSQLFKPLYLLLKRSWKNHIDKLAQKSQVQVCTIRSFVWTKTTFANQFNTVSN